MVVYDCDAFVLERQPPVAVVFPRSAEHVAAVVKICAEHNIAIVPRAAGTSLAGGCVPISPSVVVMTTRMNRILEINVRDRIAVVEPGVVNVNIAAALGGTGFHYAPDPSSQTASYLGGNVATNAGGPHTLKYGVTVNHVPASRPCWATARSSGSARWPIRPGWISGLLVGSEGTLAIVTKIWIRLTPDPQDYRTFRAIFNSVEDATNTAARSLRRHHSPALELMDQGIMEAVEAAYHFGFPSDAAAVLIIEIDGPRVGLDYEESQIAAICEANHAREVLQAKSSKERRATLEVPQDGLRRDGPLGAEQDVGRLRRPAAEAADDARKDREGEPQARAANRLRRPRRRRQRASVHPVRQRDKALVKRVWAAASEILYECLALGGSVTAEHGIGVEKLEFMPIQFGPEDLDAMRKVRYAFDPAVKFNPGKLIEMNGARR